MRFEFNSWEAILAFLKTADGFQNNKETIEIWSKSIEGNLKYYIDILTRIS